MVQICIFYCLSMVQPQRQQVLERTPDLPLSSPFWDIPKSSGSLPIATCSERLLQQDPPYNCPKLASFLGLPGSLSRSLVHPNLRNRSPWCSCMTKIRSFFLPLLVKGPQGPTYRPTKRENCWSEICGDCSCWNMMFGCFYYVQKMTVVPASLYRWRIHTVHCAQKNRSAQEFGALTVTDVLPD